MSAAIKNTGAATMIDSTRLNKTPKPIRSAMPTLPPLQPSYTIPSWEHFDNKDQSAREMLLLSRALAKKLPTRLQVSRVMGAATSTPRLVPPGSPRFPPRPGLVPTLWQKHAFIGKNFARP
jgi:hypothetical protein